MNKEELIKEISFKTARSGGSGGQNVNKVETKVTVIWNVNTSRIIAEENKNRVAQRLSSYMNVDGNVQLSSSVSRSQLDNKLIAIEKLYNLIKTALTVQKNRIPTKIPKSVIKKRLESKNKLSEKKKNRNWRKDDF